MKLIREMFPDVDIPTSRKIAEAYFYGFPDDVLDILESVGYTLEYHEEGWDDYTYVEVPYGYYIARKGDVYIKIKFHGGIILDL